MKIQHQLIEIVKFHLRVLEWVFAQLFASRLIHFFPFCILDCCRSSIFFTFVSNTTFFHLDRLHFAPDYFSCSRFSFLSSIKRIWKCDGQLFHLQSALDGNQMLFQLFAACSCDIVILFMICLGGEIIIHANDISNDVYQLNWYQFNTSSKYIVRQMIARTQSPYYFASFKSLNCSLSTFLNVWFAYCCYHCIFFWHLTTTTCSFGKIVWFFRLFEKLALFWLCFKVWIEINIGIFYALQKGVFIKSI